MFERFTDRARRVMALANQEAQRFDHEYIGTEHILLGLIKEGTGVGANVLKNLSVELAKVRSEVEKLVRRGEGVPASGKLPQTPRAKTVIEQAIVEARALNHSYVGTEHLLLGLLAERDGVAAQVLMNLGVNLQQARKEVMNLLGMGLPSTDHPAKPPAPAGLALRYADLETLIGELITRFDEQLVDLTRQKDDAVREAHYERAADLREELIALRYFKERVIRKLLDTPLTVPGVGLTQDKLFAKMLPQLLAALLESSPALAAQLGETLEKLRKAAES